MKVIGFIKKIYDDNRGHHAVESMVLLAVLVVLLAAVIHILLPGLGEGFMRMAETLGGPTP